MSAISSKWCVAQLGDLLEYEQPTQYIVSDTNYCDSYKTPVLTAGKSFLLGFTNEKTGVFINLPVIIFDDFTTAIKFVNFPFKVKSSAMKILRPSSESVNIKYVYYFMSTLRFDVDTHKRYWISVASHEKIPLPPLPEQHRIVAKIEELFSELDKAIESLKTAQQQLKVYRQAVLKHAFEGKLTNSEVKDGELPEGWVVKSFGSILKTIDGDRGHNYPNKNDFYGNGHCLFLSTKNVRNGYFDFNENTFITKEKDEVLRGGKVQKGDVIITTRGTLGNVALYDESVSFEHMRINSGMLILRINNNFVLEKYLMNFISSSLFHKQLKEKQSGTAQPQIPANVLREIKIQFPKEQRSQLQIVKEIESRYAASEIIEKRIHQGLQQVELIRQAILKKAFEGQLVPQDPNDEPASVLLERIKAERSNTEPVKKTRAKKITA